MAERGARRVTAALACVLLAAGAAACTRVGETGSGGRAPWTQTDRVRIASTEEPDSLDTLFTNSGAGVDVEALLFAPLFRYDDKGEYVPELATSVPTLANGGIAHDGRTIVIHLRPGVRWSDGAPLDARDLRFTWQAVMNPRNNTRLRAGWDDVTAIDLPNALTAVIHLREPFAAILGAFTGFPPLPAHLLAGLPDLNHAPFNEHPISSGPYALTAWNHGSSLEFAANPQYWRGTPPIPRVTYRIIPDDDTLFAALQTHAVDIADSLTESELGRLGTLTGYAIQHRSTGNFRHISFNCAKPILADVRVRRAIAEAVDWDRMNATVFHGYNQRATSDIIPGSWADPHLSAYPFDLAAAKRLLDAAGWQPGADGIRRRNGETLSLDISTTPAKPANVQAEVQMQQQLRAAGIDLHVKNYPTSLLFAQNGPLYGGRYDLSLTIDVDAPDPDNEGARSGAFIPPHGQNTTFLNDPVLTATSHAAAHTFDRAQRRALYAREEARIHDLVPDVFLYWQVATAVVNADLHGYHAARFLTSNVDAWAWHY
jgi:peptide/nickel transport system substrate-binding protein